MFTPEFRNRLDVTIFFSGLDHDVVKLVAGKFLDELDGQLSDKHVTLEVTDAARDWFAEHGYDQKFGARPMARLVQNTLKAPLANELLFGKLEHGGVALIDVVDGEITVECTARELEEDDDEAEGSGDGDTE